MGYALITLSTTTFFSIEMLLFYMFVYMVSGLIFWYILLLLKLKKKNNTTKYNKELNDLVLLKKANPALSFSLSIIMFSIAGIPPCWFFYLFFFHYRYI
jgi:NADH-quinone oxidoreductase subunit N